MPTPKERLDLEQALAEMQKSLSQTQNQEDDGDSGDEGSGADGGAGGIEIEKRLFVETFSLLRIGEKAFGPTGEFDPAAYLAKDKQQFHDGLDAANRLKNHPILSKISKFDGDTPKMSMDPKQNPDAQNRYENKLQLQLGLKLGQTHKNTPSFKPGGM